ncbi:hypothetical protein GQ457_01G013620 [Hibiscus cannabinus]
MVPARERSASPSLLSVVRLTKKGDNEISSFMDKEVIIMQEDVIMDKSGAISYVHFLDRVYDQVDHKMHNAIVVRLLSQAIGYKTLEARIHSIWKPINSVQLIDLDCNYFLVRFLEEMDYTKTIFRYIGFFIGIVVKLDYNTGVGGRGKFARLVILIDLNKPLLSCIRMDGKLQKLEYEELQQVCFSSGMHGHVKDTCGLGVDKPIALNVGVSVTVFEGGPSREDAQYNNLVGSWMLVEQRRRRPMSIDMSIKQLLNAQYGCRFAVLENEGEMTVAPMMVTCNLRVEQIGSKDRQSKGNAYSIAKEVSSELITHSSRLNSGNHKVIAIVENNSKGSHGRSKANKDTHFARGSSLKKSTGKWLKVKKSSVTRLANHLPKIGDYKRLKKLSQQLEELEEMNDSSLSAQIDVRLVVVGLISDNDSMANSDENENLMYDSDGSCDWK